MDPEQSISRATARHRVTAIIVHHRGAPLLQSCIESLLRSEGVALEVVVVANACGEPLPAAVRDPRVQVVRSPRPLGFGAANNLGLRRAAAGPARTDAYFFVNNDTRADPRALEILCSELSADPRCGVVGPRLRIQGSEDLLNSLGLNVSTLAEAWDEGIGRPAAEYPDLAARREVVAVTGSALLVRAETLAALGGWSELYGFYYEDVDLCLRARARSWGVVVAPRAVVDHAISATSDRISDFKRRLSWRNQLVLLAVHWPWGLLLEVAPRLLGGQCRSFFRRLRGRAFRDAWLQVQAWAGALRLLPAALLARRRRGRESGWTRLLRPAGSVPRIVLPRVRPRAVDGEPSTLALGAGERR